MNLVERFFADPTAVCVREGSFASVRELIEAIDEFPAVRNGEPKHYVWRKGKTSSRKIEKAKVALNRLLGGYPKGSIRSHPLHRVPSLNCEGHEDHCRCMENADGEPANQHEPPRSTTEIPAALLFRHRIGNAARATGIARIP
jgi:hypothetical protein